MLPINFKGLFSFTFRGTKKHPGWTGSPVLGRRLNLWIFNFSKNKKNNLQLILIRTGNQSLEILLMRCPFCDRNVFLL